jgi:membrane associated rhomboid family serine protease
MAAPDLETPRPAREPLFNAPWPAFALVVLILGSYLLQVLVGGGPALAERLGFTPRDLADGRWWTALTVMFVHGGWVHAIMNAVAALAFSPPVARLFGSRPGGVLGFFAFYLVCGLFSTLGYAAVHLHDPTVIIGASGAVSGMMGAASRLMGRGGRPAPLFDRQVLGMAFGWTLANLLLGLTGVAPGMSGARIAWEAHIAGFFAGMVLIGLVAPAAPAEDDPVA